VSSILQGAKRFASYGLAIVPIPHGYSQPRFDWTDYQRRAPSIGQIERWLEAKTGIGAICGRVSRNLVALEFTGPGAYLTWKNANPGLAAKLPIIGSRDADYVLFRTGQLTPTGFLFMPGYQGRAGRVLGEGSLVPLPPTLGDDGEPRKWINGLTPENLPTFISLDEVNVSLREITNTPVRTPQGLNAPTPDHGTPDSESQSPNSDRFAHLFQCSDNYRQEKEYIQEDWIVEGFLPETYLVILAGNSKSGKSCLVTALGMAIARGEPFLGLKTKCGGVLWLAFEESPRERREALEAFPKPQPGFYITHEKLLIDTPEGLEAIRWWVRQTDARLIVVDPLYAATYAESLSDGRTARAVLQGLKEICRTERCAAIILHHFNKNDSAGLTRERFADSHQIVAAASMDVLLDYRELKSATPPAPGGVGEERTGGGSPGPATPQGPNASTPNPHPSYPSHESDLSNPSDPSENPNSKIHNPKSPDPPLRPLRDLCDLGVKSDPPSDPNPLSLCASGLKKPTRRTVREITLRCRGRGDFANQTWLLTSNGVADYQLLTHGPETSADSRLRDELILKPIRESQSPLSAKEIAEITGMNHKTIQNRLTDLIRVGAVIVAERKENACLYAPPTPDTC